MLSSSSPELENETSNFDSGVEISPILVDFSISLSSPEIYDSSDEIHSSEELTSLLLLSQEFCLLFFPIFLWVPELIFECFSYCCKPNSNNVANNCTTIGVNL